MKRRFLIILAIFTLGFVASCNEKENLPEDIIPRETFVKMLADIEIFKSTHQYIQNKKENFVMDYNFEFLFKEYQVTEEVFELSMDYYTSDPKKFEEIYDDVIIAITEKQVEFSKNSEEKAAKSEKKLP